MKLENEVAVEPCDGFEGPICFFPVIVCLSLCLSVSRAGGQECKPVTVCLLPLCLPSPAVG